MNIDSGSGEIDQNRFATELEQFPNQDPARRKNPFGDAAARRRERNHLTPALDVHINTPDASFGC